MFGSTSSFGQSSSSSPFGSQSVFGQSNNVSNNPFAPKPFGSTSPFGSQTGGSLFGGTSTGVFGSTQSSSPLASAPTFGASSTPAFGSSAPAFGASTTPAFGSGSSSFGGSSVFGQKPSFGGFGSTPSQTSPFGSTFQQTQSAFGSSAFGSSTPFGASSQPAFGAPSTPAFGAPSTPAFGATPTSGFGNTGAAFSVSSTPNFGSGGAFGSSSAPAFGSSTTPGFGTPSTGFGSSTSIFGATSSGFGTASSSSFNVGSSPSIGQTTSAFGSSPFGSSPSPFGAQSSSFGSQTATSAFGTQPSFGGQRGGSRVAGYSPTAEIDGTTGAQTQGKLESISAMPVYKDKSHEELRWEDYQSGDKGGPSLAAQPAGGMGFNQPATQTNPFGASPAFSQSSANPFTSTTPTNPFAPKTPTFGTQTFGTTSTSISSPFGTPSISSPFGQATSSPAPSLFNVSSTPSSFGANQSPSIFSTSSSTPFGSSSIFNSSSNQGATSAFGTGLSTGNTQSTGLFQSTPSTGQTSIFGQMNPGFPQSAPSFSQTNVFSSPSTGFGGSLFTSGSTPSMFPASSQPLSNPFQTTQPAQTSSSFSFPNFSQAQPASNNFGIMSNGFGQGTSGQFQNAMMMQPAPVSNPFGTLPAMPQMSIGRSGSSPSVQYGISSMPVTDKPTPVRVSSLLTSRHISQRRTSLPSRKYHPKNDVPKVPFYCDDEEASSTPKADALFIPRENPRALVICPSEKWPSRAGVEKTSLLKGTHVIVHKNGSLTENGTDKEDIHHSKSEQRPSGLQDDLSPPKVDSYITVTGQRAGEAAIVYEHGANIEALMPKLKHIDYYTEPRIQELAAKERAEPGYCQRVKDFVVGRNGYGCIKFVGETDVRGLDLEYLVQFNNREVIVYMDDSKKPPVGQGLNKPAEVTLLNIKCFDKKTGQQYTEGPKVEKYKEMLMKKARDQSAEFVSYNPIKGEWKFRVSHFSQYSLQDEDEVDLDVQSSSPNLTTAM